MPNIVNDVKLDFKDVLLRPKRTNLKSRSQVSLNSEIKFRNSGQVYRGIPIIASNMDNVGNFKMAAALSKLGLFTCIQKYAKLDEWIQFASEHPESLDYVAVGAGLAEGDYEVLEQILENIKGIKFITLDVANGYMQHFVDAVKRVRARFPTHTIIAGDVVTSEMVEELILAGADIVKVGIGPGSVCTTRIKTGVGYPQLSAVIECADAAHGLNGHIISDGGCTCPGDVAKAFGAGADFVMLGGMFAGHDQSGGEVITKPDGKKVMMFYGTASSTAMSKYYGGVANYMCAEGKTVEVQYRGDVANTVSDILGGLRSTCTYLGASKLEELPRKTTFIRCSRQVNDIFS